MGLESCVLCQSLVYIHDGNKIRTLKNWDGYDWYGLWRFGLFWPLLITSSLVLSTKYSWPSQKYFCTSTVNPLISRALSPYLVSMGSHLIFQGLLLLFLSNNHLKHNLLNTYFTTVYHHTKFTFLYKTGYWFRDIFINNFVTCWTQVVQ